MRGLSIIIAATAAASLCFAERPDAALSGGETTVFETGGKAFARPLANITRKTRREHSVGNSFFNQNWVAAPASTAARDGLGPHFNARSCSACHLQDGRGAPPDHGEVALGLLARLSLADQVGPYGEPVGDPIYGGQISERALPSHTVEGNLNVSYIEQPGDFHDGELYSLRVPYYWFTGLSRGLMSEGVLISPRIAPSVHGLGLLEAVSDKDILARADELDADGDGISGRANHVYDYEAGETRLGRFGWKANQPSLRQQTASAFVGDIGITSSLFPLENDGSPAAETELSDKILDRVTTYLQTLAPPARRDVSDPTVLRGEQVFTAISCAKCHTPELRTRDDFPIPELGGQKIRPYTDLLLHDMGPELADNRPDFLASGQEWRTPPLWGIGLQDEVNGHTFFLHDGRARNLTEAILWHGGEAEASRDAFKALSYDDRQALLAFLNSL